MVPSKCPGGCGCGDGGVDDDNDNGDGVLFGKQ